MERWVRLAASEPHAWETKRVSGDGWISEGVWCQGRKALGNPLDEFRGLLWFGGETRWRASLWGKMAVDDGRKSHPGWFV